MTEKNPWLSITEGNVKIAECDVPYFERKGSVEEYAENINLKDDEAFLNTTIQNLRLRSDSCSGQRISGIKQAVKDKKLIIIMRERINWMKRLKKTIPDIEDYDNLYTLKCAQGGYLTKDNIVHIDNNGEERHLSDEEITRYFKK